MKIVRFADDRMTNTFLIPRDTILDTDPAGRNLKVVFSCQVPNILCDEAPFYQRFGRM